MALQSQQKYVHLALKLFHDCHIEDFKGAASWCYHFMKHNGL
jgi:hypothetical protein